jgi:amino acid efflux transporter
VNDNTTTPSEVPAAPQLRRTLSLYGAIVLAIGSIAGSGLLFLPSLTYATAGRSVFLAWVAAILLCIPMLLMFADVVRVNAEGAGVEAFVRSGLGPKAAGTVPVIFLAIVSIGGPAGAHVAGQYAAAILGRGGAVGDIVAYAILALAVGTNLLGASVSARAGGVVVWLLWAVPLSLPSGPSPGLRT